MGFRVRHFFALLGLLSLGSFSLGQKVEQVSVVKFDKEKRIDVVIGKKPFTSFMFTDSLEKPVLYPLQTGNGTLVNRGFPISPRAGEPTDHPHHLGIWFNFENVNGLDFWNNSFAIPTEKKQLYGWIKTDRILETSGGAKGVISYHANWTNFKNDVLLEETTLYEFSGTEGQRIIDRFTILNANVDVLFKDAKDGFLGVRVARELQIPSTTDEKFTDDKGNVTVVKKLTDSVSNGNYITSEGKQGNDAWSTRAAWCKLYGKLGKDSITIAIIDHPGNPNYPTFWHARGYGLFAANPLGENIFTNGKSTKNLKLKPGESVSFKFRIVIQEGSKTISPSTLNQLAKEFGKK